MSIYRISLFKYLLIIILCFSCIILGLVILTSRAEISRILFSKQNAQFSEQTRETMELIDHHITAVEESVARTSYMLDSKEFQRKSASRQLLEQMLRAHPTIFGSVIIFTEDQTQSQMKEPFQAIYSWRNNGQIQTDDRTDLESDHQSDWFRLPIAQRKPVWCEPYFDPQIDVLMVTYSNPIFDKKGNISTIVTADVTLNWLEEMMEKNPIGKHGSSLLLSASQKVLVSSHHNWNLKESLQSLAQKTNDPLKRQCFEHLSHEFRSKGSGQVRFRRPDDKSFAWCYFNTSSKLGWTVCCILPEKEVLEEVREANYWMMFIGILGVILFIPPSFFIARSVAMPIRRLCSAANEISKGHFDTPLPILKGNGEVVQLTNSFDKMRVDLQRYIHDLTESTRVKERIQAELNVAHSIQLGMVPKGFGSTAKFKIDLYATMEPAQEVGGDLYDFAMLDPDTFYFCIGDVSGKGIPASLFMAVGKTLMKATIQTVRDPALALQIVNNELLNHNDASLFITMLCGIFKLKAGEITLASAGHTIPILVDGDRNSHFIDVESNFPVGITPDVVYENKTFQIPHGDSLFLYTDGVTDAVNTKGEYFGTKLLLESLEKTTPKNVENLVQSIMNRIHVFANGAKQSDDITILAFINMND